MRLLRAILMYDGTGTEPLNNTIRVTNGGTPATLALASGVDGSAFYLSGDGSASDLLKIVQDALTAASISVALSIVGVTIAADLTRATGRIRAINTEGATVSFDLTHAAWTLPDGALGWAEAGGVVSMANGSTTYSPGPHRFGWYPPLPPNLSIETEHEWGEWVRSRGSLAVDGQIWGGFARRRTEWLEAVPAPFIRQEAAEDTAWQAAYGLSTGVQWGSWERFSRDVREAESDAARDIRQYPDALDEATYDGPYRFDAEEAHLFTDPIRHWDVASLAGETYRGGFELLRLL